MPGQETKEDAADPLDSKTALDELRTARTNLRKAEDELKKAKAVDPRVHPDGVVGQEKRFFEQRKSVDEKDVEVEDLRRAFEIASEAHREASRVRDSIAADKLATSNAALAKTNTAAASAVACWTKVLAVLALAQAIAAGAQACSACSSRTCPPRQPTDAGPSTSDH